MFAHRHLHHPVEVMISEVGLGGRFDAVNAVEPTVSAIVSIGYDHTEILGDNLEQILGEKLGITRPGVPLFTTLSQDHLRRQCWKYCQSKAIPLHDLHHDIDDIDDRGDRHSYIRPYIQRNAHLARKLAQWITGKAPRPEVVSTRGRWQTQGPFTFVSAHNGDGFQALCQDHRVRDFAGIIFSFSQREQKFIDQMMDVLASCQLPLYFSRRPHYKKLCKTYWPTARSQVIDSFYPTSQGPFLVTGSHYFIGEFQRAVL